MLLSTIGNFTLFSIIINICITNGLICKGCLELDELNFNKIIAKFQTVLVKFDIAFPYGKWHDEYAKFAKEINESNENADMIVCVIGIKNYGESINTELNDRFSIGDRLPAIRLFINNNALHWFNFPEGRLRRAH